MIEDSKEVTRNIYNATSIHPRWWVHTKAPDMSPQVFPHSTGINRSEPSIFCYKEYEKETNPHYAYVRETMERLGEINKLARRPQSCPALTEKEL